MKNFKKATLTAALLMLSGAVSAGNMYIDLGSNGYESFPNTLDANSTTGSFSEFGFSQLLATSIYDMTDGTIFGGFYDTNITSELNAVGVPTILGGTAMDGTTLVDLVLPVCGAQCDIDALSPLAPPLGSDSEGFLLTWDLQVEYHFDGTMTAGGPIYTGGYFDIIFNDFNNDANDRTVITGTLTGSNITLANLDIFFDITFAEAGFLYIENSSGNFVDANDGTVSGDFATMQLDTNVSPPIPTADQLVLVGTNAIRQSNLDGSITAAVPEPATIAIMGLGLLGLGAASRRRSTKKS